MHRFRHQQGTTRFPRLSSPRFSLATSLVLATTALFGSVVPAGAQAVYGSIFGTVSDKSGAVVPNANITVTDIAKGTSVTAQTNGSGEFRVQHLIPDTYRVDAESAGFDKTSVQGVVVFADTAPKVDLQLSVGTAANNVIVNGGASLLETDRADVSTILNARAVENLPNLNRNFTAFELLTPGTTYIGWSLGQAKRQPAGSQQIEVNGQLPLRHRLPARRHRQPGSHPGCRGHQPEPGRRLRDEGHLAGLRRRVGQRRCRPGHRADQFRQQQLPWLRL